MTPRDYMERAVALSLANIEAGTGGPFGAVLVKNGRIIGEGANAVTSANDPTAHAEVMAIRAACQTLGTFNLEGAELYTSCEPCPMCLAAAYWAHISRIYYGNTAADAAAIDFADDHIYRELRLPIAERSLPMDRLCGETAHRAFDEWIAKNDRIAY